MLTPESVWLPPETVTGPVPLITPANVVLPAVMVSGLAPSVVEPLPASVVMEAPDVVVEISNTPLSVTPEDEAMAPDPVRVSVAPELMVVRPV